MSTRKPRTTPPKPAPASRPPMLPGPGRPRKPRAPRTEQQAALAVALEAAEAQRDAALEAYAADTSVAAELRLLRAGLAVASAWASYLRAQGLHTWACKYAEQEVRLAGRIAGLRELEAADKLDKLVARGQKEDALAKRKGHGKAGAR